MDEGAVVIVDTITGSDQPTCIHCGTFVDPSLPAPEGLLPPNRAHASCWAMLVRELPQFCCKGPPTNLPPRL